jgi:hypothetical protein
MVCKGRLRHPSDASTRSVVRAGNDGWSLYGAQRSQPVASGGKWDGRMNGSNTRKPLRWVATGCLRRSMASAPISRSGDATGRRARLPLPLQRTQATPSPPRTSTQRPCADATERDCSSTTARPARRTHPRIRGRLSLRTRRVPVAGHVVAGRTVRMRGPVSSTRG